MKIARILASTIAVGAIACSNSWAISIDLSGATTGTSITAPGGSFAQSFVGQTVAGQGLSGSPGNPLTLQPGGTLLVAFFNGFNTILPQPGNQAPLSVLLDQSADAISWVMGFGNPPSSVTIDFYRGDGSLVQSLNQTILEGYNTYSYSGFGAFAGLSIYNNDDLAGLRFYDFQYDPASSNGVPETGSTLVLLALGLLSMLGVQKARLIFA